MRKGEWKVIAAARGVPATTWEQDVPPPSVGRAGSDTKCAEIKAILYFGITILVKLTKDREKCSNP